MRISTIGYSMKQGVKNIGRNKLFSIASIATMAACIFLFGLFYSIVVNFNYIVEKAEEGVAITVFFEEDATDEQKANGLDIADFLLMTETPQMALQRLIKQHPPLQHLIDSLGLVLVEEP